MYQKLTISHDRSGNLLKEKKLLTEARKCFNTHAQNQFSCQIKKVHSTQCDFSGHKLLGEAFHRDIKIIRMNGPQYLQRLPRFVVNLRSVPTNSCEINRVR